MRYTVIAVALLTPTTSAYARGGGGGGALGLIFGVAMFIAIMIAVFKK